MIVMLTGAQLSKFSMFTCSVWIVIDLPVGKIKEHPDLNMV